MTGLFERLTGWTLLAPGLLVLLLAIPALLIWVSRRGRPALLFGPGALLERRPLGPSTPRQPEGGRGSALPRSWRVRLLAVPPVLYALGLAVLAVAVARPAARVALPDTSEGIDLILCIDVSSSMKTNDLDRARTRLEVAQAAATVFVASRSEDRIGLVSFARFPDLVCPLTQDREAVANLIARLKCVESDGPEDATAIGAAVARSAQVLSAAGGPSRVVVLLTDGEENVALADAEEEIAPIHAAQLCEQLGVRVYAIAVGTGRPGGAGDWVPLDTREIERVATRTGGTFLRARDATSLGQVYEEIDRLETAPLAEPRYGFEDRYLPFLAAAIALLLASILLEATVWDVLP